MRFLFWLAMPVACCAQTWNFEGDPAIKMVDGIHAYLDRETAAAAAARHNRSNAPDRERLLTIIGAVDPRLPVTTVQYDATSHAVRWPVFEGVDGEGILLQPKGPPKARIIAIPDAGVTPETWAELWAGAVAAGCQVLIPELIDRSDTWSGIPGVRMTNQPHREWIYRMAFETGRHIIGYEVQKVLAGVDWFEHENQSHAAPIAVAGQGEGGLLALYSASIDPRISAALVSGYFGPREGLATEPIYRDVWGLLRDFGDAELARMIAPRRLIVEMTRFPVVTGPPAETPERKGAAPVARIVEPSRETVRQEIERARVRSIQLVDGGQGPATLLRLWGLAPTAASAIAFPGTDPSVRQHRQFDQLVNFTQALIRKSEQSRADFWARGPQPLREYIWNEVIGRLPDPNVPANPRTRQILDEPKFRGYEVMLDVWPGVFAYGILLVPKDIRPGERRPVVVCQHGLEGRPMETADPRVDSHYYHRFAVRLAEEGFVTFSPQNPYIGEDRFRSIQRKAHPLRLSLFSFILGQHQRILEWLGEQPYADRARIGFYGLSYGGKTAMRVPPLLGGYALSICSADFNEWVSKTTSVESRYSYMVTQEYDMLEWNFANVVNYSDLANLMAPRPFMVERGHDDGVAPDEWVAYEYAKVRRFYDKMGFGDRTEIEFFNGPHTINGVGTFAFLRKHLW
jgi:dienelactone hydrolase